MAVANLPDQLTAALAERYHLERELGRGGMATVYLARDLRHKRLVALKVLHPELAATLGPERFQREIEISARLQHPHILTVHDSGAVAGQLWFTMPYVEGESLRDRLRRETQLPLVDALRIATDAARALQYAHEHDVIHRDIKPENLLLTRDGSILVADFGVGRVLSGVGEQLTGTGISVGTPLYMSPEQSAGDRNLDARSDVYSLGTVLYEMLVGEPPFTGPTAQAIIAKRFSDPVPAVRRLRPSIPEGLEVAVTRALAPIPADRFATAAEFARALQPSMTPVAVPTASSRLARHNLLVAAVALVVGLLIGLGVLYALRRTFPRGDEMSAGVKRVAVLPFENIGDSAHAYFADGVANDVRTKLSQIAGLAVIARGSSNQYKGSNKSQQQIARELGVDYLLTAMVQWERAPDGSSRVRVTPELVDVRSGDAPQTRWGQSFDAAMTGVFQVQADIATQVAQALNVALGDSTRRELAAKPTQNLSAYHAFLRGEAAFRREPRNLDQAIAAYEEAVTLDSTFAEAWLGLAETQGRLYTRTPTPALAEAVRLAADRALAVAPTSREGHSALGAYYGFVLVDYARALIHDSLAFSIAPGNAELLGYVGWDELTLGRWGEARRHLEQAVRLDPRSRLPVEGLCLTLLYTRDYRAAERAGDRALQLASADPGLRVMRAKVALAQGDLLGAQAVLRAVPKEVNPSTFIAYVGSFGDERLSLPWSLDDQQQQDLLRLPPSAFDEDRATWGLALAQTYHLRGNTAKARAYGDSARKAFQQELRAAPQGAERQALHGLALAYSGRKVEAIQVGKRALALMPLAKDAQVSPYIQHQLVSIFILVGEPEKALDQLEPLLKIPYYLSPGWLKIDPNFNALRGNPRFDRLMHISE
jgi:serine/threonine-protein kinase